MYQRKTMRESPFVGMQEAILSQSCHNLPPSSLQTLHPRPPFIPFPLSRSEEGPFPGRR